MHGVWKHHKKSHSTLRAKRRYLYILNVQKFIEMAKMVHLASFWKPEAGGKTVLQNTSVLIGQKLVESAIIQKFKCDILSHFQTMCYDLKEEDFCYFSSLFRL